MVEPSRKFLARPRTSARRSLSGCCIVARFPRHELRAISLKRADRDLATCAVALFADSGERTGNCLS